MRLLNIVIDESENLKYVWSRIFRYVLEIVEAKLFTAVKVYAVSDTSMLSSNWVYDRDDKWALSLMKFDLRHGKVKYGTAVKALNGVLADCVEFSEKLNTKSESASRKQTKSNVVPYIYTIHVTEAEFGNNSVDELELAIWRANLGLRGQHSYALLTSMPKLTAVMEDIIQRQKAGKMNLTGYRILIILSP
jgi:hypothetical protein